MKTLEFTKIVGTGNDFILFDARKDWEELAPAQIQSLCDRRNGIGADGIILLCPSDSADFKMRILNADGSEAEMCGNGARCVAQFAQQLGIEAPVLHIETLGGPIEAILEDGSIRINMGKPSDIRPAFIKKLEKTSYEIYFMNTGVPHAVIFVENIESLPVKELGRMVRHLPEFQPEGCNCNFVERLDSHRIKVRTYERGVEDETYSCGTGTCASAIIAVMHKGLAWPIQSQNAQKETLAIDSSITKEDPCADFFLKGSVHTTYKGEIKL